MQSIVSSKIIVYTTSYTQKKMTINIAILKEVFLLELAIESNVSIGFFGLLTIAFIVLKLCKVIDWSWWWVLAPTWISIAIAVVAVILIVLFSDN